MHLEEEGFWSMTPAMFCAMADRHLSAVRLADRQNALLPCLFANALRDPKKQPQPFTVEQFMLTVTAKERRDREIERSLAGLTALAEGRLG